MFNRTQNTFIFVLFTVIIILFSTELNAQSSLNYRWYINANGGLAQFFGDVQNENNHFAKLQNETDIGYGVRLGKYISPVFAAHFQFLNSNLLGQKDANDIKFTSNVMEYQLGATVNLINLFAENKERRVNLYLLTGVSALMFRSEALRISSDILVNDIGYTTEGERAKASRETAFAIPIGGGLDFKLADRWYLNLETALRLTNTDNLDAIESGSHNDAYYYTSLGLSFNFSRKQPKEKKPKEAKAIETAPTSTSGGDNVNLIYDIPRELKSYDEFVMKSEIHKGDINGPAQLTQILPIGFEVLDTIIGNAKVEFKNYTLNLYWSEVPADSIFEVSYRVRLNKIYGTLPLNSVLYFEKTEKEYSFKTNVFIELFEPDAIVAEPIVIVEPEVEEEFEMVIAEPKPAVEAEEIIPQKDVEFRVQVRAAFKAKIPLQNLAGKYKLYAEIQEDYLGSWYRYSIGSFTSYNEAKSYRNTIIGEHGVRDAFIVAYYHGKRLNRLSELKELAPDAYPHRTKYKENGICYRVQMLALMKSEIAPETLKEIYAIQDVVNEEVYHNWRKYTIGKCKTKEEAVKIREEIVSRGVADAFIVVYKNGERVTFNGHL
ncbi:MAG: SPOR domain-containing protein [Bacteroidales bacterium]|nr:SPOR domain-containing protein [Bacteroidales bacterium]